MVRYSQRTEFKKLKKLKGKIMKTKHIAMTAIALSTLLLASSPVFAEDGPPMPPPEEMATDKGGPRADSLEKRRAEFDRLRNERFEKTDTDHDNFLSKDEMLANQKERLDEMFEKTDTNKDGKLSPEELKKGREEMRAKYKEKMKERRENKMGGKMDDKPSE